MLKSRYCRKSVKLRYRAAQASVPAADLIGEHTTILISTLCSLGT